MIYRLKSKYRPDFECEIETNADIEPIIREYRTTDRSVRYNCEANGTPFSAPFRCADS